MTKIDYRPISKKELASILGVSTETLRRWLNVELFGTLQKFGYKKNQKLLVGHQLEYIFDYFCICQEEK